MNRRYQIFYMKCNIKNLICYSTNLIYRPFYRCQKMFPFEAVSIFFVFKKAIKKYDDEN